MRTLTVSQCGGAVSVVVGVPPMEPIRPLDIAVVEDDDAIRALLLEVLAEHGSTGRGIASGREVVAALSTTPPRLILLDRRLGDGDAAHVLAALRGTPFLRYLPVVLMSARATVADDAAAVEVAGALAKPFTAHGVLACVARFLDAPPGSRAVEGG